MPMAASASSKGPSTANIRAGMRRRNAFFSTCSFIVRMSYTSSVHFGWKQVGRHRLHDRRPELMPEHRHAEEHNRQRQRRCGDEQRRRQQAGADSQAELARGRPVNQNISRSPPCIWRLPDAVLMTPKVARFDILVPGLLNEGEFVMLSACRVTCR